MKLSLKLAILFILVNVFANAQTEGVIIDKVVAVVGKNIITLSDVENQFSQRKAQGNAGTNAKCEIFEELLYQEILLDQAQKDSIEITENEIEENLDRRIKYFVSQIGSELKLEEFYNKSISEIKDEFREAIAKQMLSERMQSSLTQSVKVTPTEILKFYKDIPTDSLPNLNKQIILEQIVKYPPIAEKEKLNIKERLRNYRDRVMKGEKFSTLAVLYSEDVGSARKGGELGFLGRNDLVPQFAAVAFKLKEKGDISRIVETEFGFHIVQLIEKRGELMNLRHILIKPKVQPMDLFKAQAFIDSVRTLIITDSISFKKAAAQFSEDTETNKNDGLMINPMTGNSVFENEQLNPSVAYAMRNLKEGDITKPFKTQDNQGKEVYKIIRIKKIIEPHTASINQDYKLIQDMCLADKKQRFINLWIKRKQASVYIKLEDDFKNCSFKHPGWLK